MKKLNSLSDLSILKDSMEKAEKVNIAVGIKKVVEEVKYRYYIDPYTKCLVKGRY